MNAPEPAWGGLKAALAQQDYIASEELAIALHLALSLGRPLLLEGAAGVGKTEIALTLAKVKEAELIRLQCYEGLDATHAIYEWNYQRQLLAIRAAAEGGEAGPAVEARLFSETYLMERPLLAALRCKKPAVLLIDEVDRSDEEFEAYLLEILSDFQVTIPELGTIRATTRPHVILTANGTRDLSDALRRRCIYAYVDFPDRATELAILKARLPDLDGRLAGQVARFMALLRKEELQKTPGVAEMLDFAAALSGFGVNDITAEPAALQAALCAVLKTREDAARVPRAVSERLASKAA